MSLRGFHIVFITLAVLCTMGFGVWTILSGSDANTPLVQKSGVVSGLAGAFLLVYGVWFYRNKLNDSALS